VQLGPGIDETELGDEAREDEALLPALDVRGRRQRVDYVERAGDLVDDEHLIGAELIRRQHLVAELLASRLRLRHGAPFGLVLARGSDLSRMPRRFEML
jgi:hypothetical protein